MTTLRRGDKGELVKVLQGSLNLLQDGVFGKITEEAVRDFQRKNGLFQDGVVGNKTWAKLLITNMTFKVSKRRINEIIIHCTATKEGKDYTVADVTAMHKQRGFTTIGYHYLVYRDGSIHEGRDVNIIGAHCVNHNTNSIGVCYVGGVMTDGKTPRDTRTDAQKKSLRNLLVELKKIYPSARIRGHCDFAAKACPCFDATKEYKDL